MSQEMTPILKRLSEIQERLKAATPINLANLPDYAMGIKMSVVPVRGFELSVNAPLENASLYHHASADLYFLTQALTEALGALERECCCTGERSLIAPYDFVKCDACGSLDRIDQLAGER